MNRVALAVPASQPDRAHVTTLSVKRVQADRRPAVVLSYCRSGPDPDPPGPRVARSNNAGMDLLRTGADDRDTFIACAWPSERGAHRGRGLGIAAGRAQAVRCPAAVGHPD